MVRKGIMKENRGTQELRVLERMLFLKRYIKESRRLSRLKKKSEERQRGGTHSSIEWLEKERCWQCRVVSFPMELACRERRRRSYSQGLAAGRREH